ncbi:Dishevelled associated activator of morphogenesis 2 [Dinochytrium kinnereticum]|nr:Dishevelled associated activator of morphogenesis 2 [Dinochytrium kinnereticum]
MSINIFSRKKTVKEKSLEVSGAIPTASSNIPHSRSREKIAINTAKDSMPPDSVINQQFEDFLADMALPTAKMDQMRAMTSEKKWMLLLQQQAKMGNNEVIASPTREPQAFVDILNNSTYQPLDLSKDLQSLEVALRTEPINWVKEFVRVGGLDALISQLQRLFQKSNPTQVDKDCQLYSIRAMKAQLNNTFGLQAAINHPEGVRSLALGLGCPSLRIQTLTIEVLAAVCFVPPRGHALILDALENVKKGNGINRFQNLVDILENETSKDQSAQYLEYQISCMTFINAIVNSPEDLAFRVTLRNEFMDINMASVLPTLREINSEDLNNQLNIFEEEGAYDFELLAERLQAEAIDFRDEEEVFECLKERLEDTECSPYLLSILQSLSLLPLDKARRKKYWQLSAEVIKQVSLQRHGINPDTARLQINISQFIDSATGGTTTVTAQRPSETRRNSREAKKEHRASVKAAEFEAKITESAFKMRQLEAEISALREREQVAKSHAEEVLKLRQNVAELNGRIVDLNGQLSKKAQMEKENAFKSGMHSRDNSQSGNKTPSESSGSNLNSSSNGTLNRAFTKTAPPPPPHKPTVKKGKTIGAASDDALSASEAPTFSGTNPPPPPPPPPPSRFGGSPPARPGASEPNLEVVSLAPSGSPPPPPPPPPSMPGGGPPPPPPQPPGKGMAGGVPPPPPPPGLDTITAGLNLPSKPKVVPNVKMRPLAWNKISPQQVGSTMWKQLAEKRDGEERLRKEKVDVRELEELFGLPNGGGKVSALVEEEGLGSNGALNSSMSLDRLNGGSPTRGLGAKQQAVTLIDAKRQNNCCIMLGRVRHKFSEIRDAVLSVNETILTENIVKQFISFIPTDEEIGVIRDYIEDGSGNPAARLKELGKAEQFFYEMSKIPRYQNRLNSIYFRFRFAERLEELKPSVLVLLNASRQIKDSKKLSKLLELILVIGNYMNGDSFRGGAYGFSIDTLSKINQDISELVKGFRDLEAEIKIQQQSQQQPNDRFVEVFTLFAQQYREPFLELQGKKSDAETAFKSAVEFFGEDPKSATPESFFNIFWKFSTDLEKSRKDAERDAETQRKAAERADKMKSGVSKSSSVEVLSSEQSDLAVNSKKFSRSQDILNSERKGVMDDLISSLKTGEMYRAKLKHRSVNPVSIYGSSKTAFGEDEAPNQVS